MGAVLLKLSPRQMNRKQQTIRELKSSFIDLIILKGSIENITILDITDRANLNRGTFYTHFNDKYDLTTALFADAIDEIATKLKELTPIGTKRIKAEGILPSTKCIFEHIEEHKSLYAALDLLDLKHSLYERFEMMFYSLLKEKEVVFVRESSPHETDGDNDLIISYYIHSIIGIIKYWIRSNFKYTASYMGEQLTSMYSNRVTGFLMSD